MMFRQTRVQIDTRVLAANLDILKKWNGRGFFCPMVKANAYGHGEQIVARVIEQNGADAMGVALVEEGVSLRQAGIRAPILAFAPLSIPGAAAVVEHELIAVIGRFEDFSALDRLSKPVRAHLKFNSGMQRLGFDEGDVPRVKAQLAARDWIRVEGCCTHLTHGEDAAEKGGQSQQQIKRFLRMCKDFPGARHAHKSSSLAALQDSPKEGIGARPGIGLYGLAHDGAHVGAGLKPALRWLTELVHVHTIDKGESVSYSARWTAARPSVIGVIPVGYGDGYLRTFSNKSFVLCRGERVPVVGSVCMDYTLVDLTDLPRESAPARAGEEVVVIGRQGNQEISALELAELAGTITYEVVTAIGARVAREAV